MIAVKEFPGYFLTDDLELIKIESKKILPTFAGKDKNALFTLKNNDTYYYKNVCVSSIIKENPIPNGEKKIEIKGAPNFFLFKSGQIFKEKILFIKCGYKKEINSGVWTFKLNGKQIQRAKSSIIAQYSGIYKKVNKQNVRGELALIQGTLDCYLNKKGEAFRFDKQKQIWQEICTESDGRAPQYMIPKTSAINGRRFSITVKRAIQECFGDIIIAEKIMSGLVPIEGFSGYFIDQNGVIFDDQSKSIKVNLKNHKSKGNGTGFPSVSRYVSLIQNGKITNPNYDLLKLKNLHFPKLKKVNTRGGYCYLDDHGNIFSDSGKLLIPFEQTGVMVVKPMKRRVGVANLIAQTLIDNPNQYSFIKHKNGNFKDCRPANLEWISDSERKEIRGLKLRKKNTKTAEEGLTLADTPFLLEYYQTKDKNLLETELKRISAALYHLPFWREVSAEVFLELTDKLNRFRLKGDLIKYSKSLAYLYKDKDRINDELLIDSETSPQLRKQKFKHILSANNY